MGGFRASPGIKIYYLGPHDYYCHTTYAYLDFFFALAILAAFLGLAFFTTFALALLFLAAAFASFFFACFSSDFRFLSFFCICLMLFFNFADLLMQLSG